MNEDALVVTRDALLALAGRQASQIETMSSLLRQYVAAFGCPDDGRSLMDRILADADQLRAAYETALLELAVHGTDVTLIAVQPPALDEPFVHQHCADGHHQVCMRIYGGRSCECACHGGA